MIVFLTVLHVLVCLFLVVVVLLQRGKGAEIGAVFGGGGSSTVFGSRGAGNFLTRLTTASAVIFMITSIALSYMWTQASQPTLFDDETLEESAPAEEPLFEELPPPGGEGATGSEGGEPGAGAGLAEEPAAP